ncbi:DUF6630 family protein [Ottowia thiooxydans]|uniref:DUF6630 family protein n=1 Tax=Ottowia thiooxydans TaxID=219182 RepID=UPI00048AB9A4|nr:hypothetical protein [Ottowia thiooxydans]
MDAFPAIQRGLELALLKYLTAGFTTAASHRATMDQEHYWNDICEHLCPGDDSLRQDVKLSIENPQSYLEKFDDALWERGIEEPSFVRPWLALVDGLISRGYACEMDWKLDPNELAFQLEKLHPCKSRNIQLSSLRNSTEVGAQILLIAAKELRNHSLELLFLEIDGDCYPLSVVPSAKTAEVLSLSQLLKQNAAIYP